jgi:methionyl aminopeptidase
MSIKRQSDRDGMTRVSKAVALTLHKMREYTRPGMSTKQVDEYGGQILKSYGARSAPALAYGFPGFTCISLNHEIAHGIPSGNKIIREGDLINIDVSAELNGFWSDNGSSVVVGENLPLLKLVQSSKAILLHAISQIKEGVLISHIGRTIESLAKESGYRVIKNLTGHGIGKKLHEAPDEIPNYYDPFNRSRFKNNSVVAVETFISTNSNMAFPTSDGWTLIGNRGGFVAQHEHTIVVTKEKPVILTEMNGI